MPTPSDTLREALPKLPKKSQTEWKPKTPKGVISQEAYDQSRAKKGSFKPK